MRCGRLDFIQGVHIASTRSGTKKRSHLAWHGGTKIKYDYSDNLHHLPSSVVLLRTEMIC